LKKDAFVNLLSISSASQWHTHPKTDEMFVVLSGSVTIDRESESFLLAQNDCFIVKAGTRHRARAAEKATLMPLIGKNTLV
jgi:mannose-6-phosphate isomerase-like protein (cupin superfamily)